MIIYAPYSPLGHSQRVADIDILYARKEVFIHGKKAD